MVGEFVSFAVPTEFLAGEFGGFGGQQCGFGDADTDLEWSPEGFLGALAVVDPVAPVVAAADIGHGFVFDDFSFAEDGGFAIGLEEQSAFFADDKGVVGADSHGRQTERGEGRLDGGVVVMNDEFFADELTAAARVGEDALVVSGVRGVRRFLAIGDDGFR